MGAQRIVTAALVALGGGALFAAPDLTGVQTLPRPIVSVSTATPLAAAVARDSMDVVLNFTASCAPTGCATQYRLAGIYDGERVVGRTVNAPTRIVTRVARPVCPAAKSIRFAVVADRGTVSSAIGTHPPLAIRCRPASTAERAFLDSFPSTHRRIVACSAWGLRMDDGERAEALALNLRTKRTAADSAQERNFWEGIRVGPDSLRAAVMRGDTLTLAKGYKYRIAWLGKNRYTGRVREIIADRWSFSNPDIVAMTPGPTDCTAKIAEWESERVS